MKTMLNPTSEARQLRQEVWNNAGKVSFPVDPFVMAARLGINVELAPLASNTAGVISRENGHVRVALNSGDSRLRQRFTLAHELGHFVQRRGGDEELAFVDLRDEVAASGTDWHEIWANSFAAELLMPASILRKWWARGDSPEDMRRKLQVSRPAFAIRLENLGLL